MLVRFAFSLTRVWEHYNRGNFAIISPYKGEDPEADEERAKALKQAVRKLGYGYVEIKGVWGGAKEYPLFIPGIAFEDAMYLGSGDYFDGVPQWSILYADDDSIYEIRTDEAAPQIVGQYDKLETNFKKAWEAWSEYKGRKWRYANVEWFMGEPPPKEPASWAQARARVAWRDSDPHDFYDRRLNKGPSKELR